MLLHLRESQKGGRMTRPTTMWQRFGGAYSYCAWVNMDDGRTYHVSQLWQDVTDHRSGAYRPYRKYRKCGMAGGDVPRGAPRVKKKLERALAGRRPARAFGLRSANVGGGDRSPRGPWYGPRGATFIYKYHIYYVMHTFFGHPKTTCLIFVGRHATYATYNHADSGF